MCGCSKKKVGVNMTPKNTPKRMYDFQADPNFVLVESRSIHYKDIKSPTLSADELLQRYGKRSYGMVAYGTRINMLREDYEYYNSRNISGVDLVLVNQPVSEVEAELTVENEPEVEKDLTIVNEPENENVVTDVNPNDFTLVKGIGSKTQEKLNELGYLTFEDLSKLTYEEWNEIRPTSTEEGWETMMEEIKSYVE